MSQENVELARQAIDAFNRRDLGAYLELVNADVEFVAGGVTMEGDYQGHAGIRRFWENLLGVFPDLADEVVEMRDLGDLTLGAARVRGHGAGSETPVDETLWGVAEWRDGNASGGATTGLKPKPSKPLGCSNANTSRASDTKQPTNRSPRR